MARLNALKVRIYAVKTTRKIMMPIKMVAAPKLLAGSGRSDVHLLSVAASDKRLARLHAVGKQVA